MSEAALWANMRRRLRGRWDAQRHEDRLSLGVPDVSYAARGVDGWIELKYVRDWPAREATPVRCGLTREQAVWLRARGAVGAGRCWILVRVGRREHYLFHWRNAGWLCKGITRKEFGHMACLVMPDGLDADALLDVIGC